MDFVPDTRVGHPTISGNLNFVGPVRRQSHCDVLIRNLHLTPVRYLVLARCARCLFALVEDTVPHHSAAWHPNRSVPRNRETGDSARDRPCEQSTQSTQARTPDDFLARRRGRTSCGDVAELTSTLLLVNHPGLHLAHERLRRFRFQFNHSVAIGPRVDSRACLEHGKGFPFLLRNP